MSQISTIFDAINTFIGTYFPNHKVLVNPYDLQKNDKLILNKAIGFYLGPAVNTNRQISCYHSVRRDLVFNLTRVNRGTDRDDDIRQTVEKELLEDHFTLVKEFEKDPTMQSLCSNTLWTSDNGIEFVYDDKISYLKIETRFSIEYLEQL